MVENTQVVLTEDEKELYDRQIRLWGYEAQWKLKNARILVIGMDGLGAEIVKNTVLSGVKSLLMWDDKSTSENDFANQFLIPQSSINLNRAEASKTRAQALNPLVLIETDTQPLDTEKPDGYYSNFELVVSCNQLTSFNKKIDELCRKASTPFFAAGVYGTFGYIFYDLNTHKFASEKVISRWDGDKKTESMEVCEYPSLHDVFESNLITPAMDQFVKKSPPSVFILAVLVKFEQAFNCRPTSSDTDLLNLLENREAVVSSLNYAKDRFPKEVLKCVVSGVPSPICAIVGAIAAQELVKTVTQKGEPHRNFFFFDPITLSGHVLYVGP